MDDLVSPDQLVWRFLAGDVSTRCVLAVQVAYQNKDAMPAQDFANSASFNAAAAEADA